MTDFEKEMCEHLLDWPNRVHEAQSSPEILQLRGRLNSLRPLFKDMITPENDFSYDDVALFIVPSTYWGGEFKSYELSISVSDQAYKRWPNITLLHEMIHLHIFKMAEEERLQCKKRLEKELRASVPHFDSIMEYKDLALEALFSLNLDCEFPDPSDHDDLFFLKSLDIDQRRNYKFGAVFEYGMKECIKNIQRASGGDYMDQQVDHWRNMIKKREGSS